jgi:hypothetical protein
LFFGVLYIPPIFIPSSPLARLRNSLSRERV